MRKSSATGLIRLGKGRMRQEMAQGFAKKRQIVRTKMRLSITTRSNTDTDKKFIGYKAEATDMA
jgi:hypothetical protein